MTLTAAGGIAGGCLAGMIGGLIYGLALTTKTEPQGGALSTLLVLTSLTTLVAIIGGAGVSLGIGTAGYARPQSLAWTIPAAPLAACSSAHS